METKNAIAALAALSLVACAKPMWVSESATSADFERDRLECQAEMPLAEAHYAMSLAARGHAVAVKEMNADEAAKAMFRANLMRLCLLSRGYRQLDMDQLAAIGEHVPEPPPMFGAPAGSID